MAMIRIASIRDLGPQFRENSHRMVGQDGAYSIPTQAGLLWFFGDTLIGARRPGESLWYPDGKPVGHADMSGLAGIEHMINNTGLLSSTEVGPAGIAGYRYILDGRGGIKPLIPLERGEDPDWIRVWCLHGIEVEGKICLFFVKVETVEEGIFPVNFRILGSGLAAGEAREWSFTRILHNGSDIWWPAEQPHFASAVLAPAGDWLYLYGVLQGEDKIQRCYLARVRREEITRLDRYEYLCAPAPGSERGLPRAADSGCAPDEPTGPAWSSRIEEAVPLFDGMPNEQSVSWNPWLGCYLAVHSLDLSGKIVARTAPEPWGPWSTPAELYQVRCSHPAHLPYPQLIYAGKEHPALAREGGRIIYVTYIEFEEYYPHLLEITLY